MIQVLCRAFLQILTSIIFPAGSLQNGITEMSNEFRQLHFESAKVTFAHEKDITIAYAYKGNQSVVIGRIVRIRGEFNAFLEQEIPFKDLGLHSSEEKAKRAVETALNDFIVRNELNPWPSSD